MLAYVETIDMYVQNASAAKQRSRHWTLDSAGQGGRCCIVLVTLTFPSRWRSSTVLSRGLTTALDTKWSTSAAIPSLMFRSLWLPENICLIWTWCKRKSLWRYQLTSPRMVYYVHQDNWCVLRMLARINLSGHAGIVSKWLHTSIKRFSPTG